MRNRKSMPLTFIAPNAFSKTKSQFESMPCDSIGN